MKPISKKTAMPAEGLFYIVRFPSGWKAICRRFKGDEDFGHSEFWENEVAGLIAREWALILQREPGEFETDLREFVYAFPRGRVVRQGKHFSVYHGCDIERFMKVAHSEIEAQFGICGLATWEEDLHEHCQLADKDCIRDMLGLEENWKHATPMF